jgi:glucosamine-6-phosphate deaminase
MNLNLTSEVEKAFLEHSPWKQKTSNIPYITVENFPKLGLLASLRFLEWVSKNPTGVISLPTGKTPEYFIKYTKHLLHEWDNPKGKELRNQYGLGQLKKPNLADLQFVQIDEFYPISPKQHNSFYNYVMEYYIKGFGLNPKNGLFMNSDEIPLYKNKSYQEIFPDSTIDLSLRYREAKNKQEERQQKSIFMIDNWCNQYEQKIRDKGGIGFFLGGIGPDGHIAFNTRGSDHYSTTRLTSTNFETQAVAAGDLGGMEISRNRLVITIGLKTITFNPDCVSIIFAAGEAKADIVKASLESKPDVCYPATVLQNQNNSRFYLTTGAACKLEDALHHYYASPDASGNHWSDEKTERAVIDLCQKIDKYAYNLSIEDLQSDPYCAMIPDLNEQTVARVIDRVKAKITKGMQKDRNQSIYHTGPHHDDIMLGIMPYTNRQVRSATNNIHFSILTSGFTAVTNKFVIEHLQSTLHLIGKKQIQMVYLDDFFTEGFRVKWDKDVNHYLNSVAAYDEAGKLRGICHRLVRCIVQIWEVRNIDNLSETIQHIVYELNSCYEGEKNNSKVQQLKGMIREFEEELVWAHLGVPIKNIHHLRLGFYKGDIFTEQPEKQRDIQPILEELRTHQPTILSLTMDPEGSGPDTHYKVLQAIAGAVKEWQKEKDLSNLKIIGYRNVWFKYHPAEADVFVPVSLNAMHVLQNSFSECYKSQVNASFPSYEYDGKFSDLTQRIWVQQLKQIQYVLGKDYFYENELPLIRATHGMVYLKEMNAKQFVDLARELENAMEENPFE